MSSNPREVSFDSLLPETFTALVYGPLRSGKTEFLATFPKVRLLADSIEKGYETVRTVPKDKLWEPKVMPQVRRINTIKDMHEELALALIDAKAGQIKTLAFDSITFLAQMIEMKLRVEFASEIAKNSYFIYNKILEQISGWQVKAHGIGINVVWSGIQNVEESGSGGVSIPGKMKTLLPGAVDLLARSEILTMPVQPGGLPESAFALRTRPTPKFPAGGRGVFGYLPDPIIDPTYRGLMDALAAALQSGEEDEPEVVAPALPMKKVASKK